MSADRRPIEAFLNAETGKTAGRPALVREFYHIAQDRFLMHVRDLGLCFDLDRARRERSELVGELNVKCTLPGARTVNGSLSVADFNLSSARSRTDRAKLLAGRACTRDVDWSALIEEFCQRVLQADREGSPAVDLRDVPLPDVDQDMIRIEGLVLPRRHPAIVFGDGGSAKSLLGLYLAGRMVQTLGVRCGYFDWELDAPDHRARLGKLFPGAMPEIFYARCNRPLVYEADRLRRIAQDTRIEYAIFDSVAYACDAAPESAEAAQKYFRALRETCPASLHLAHVTRGEGADKRPFGSVFWSNSARCTYYVEKASEEATGDTLRIGLFCRKNNLGRLSPPAGFEITFAEDRTAFKRRDVADAPEFAKQLSVRQRMVAALKRGGMDVDAIAEEIEAEPETVRRTIRRYKDQFTVIEGGKVGLLARQTE
jgi:hypothetical protein